MYTTIHPFLNSPELNSHFHASPNAVFQLAAKKVSFAYTEDRHLATESKCF